MLKIFVTGDNHIGLTYRSHEKGEILASKRTDAFRGMVEAANSESCDLFAITGDLFENTYSITKGEVKALLEILSAFRGTVAVLPGNHDYYDKDAKLWRYFRDIMETYDNILLLTEYRPYKLQIKEQTVVLYPALCTSLHSLPGQNNLGWIKESTIEWENAYHIAMAHGAVEGETIDREGQYFLMTRSELEDIPVDVWLLGHTHVPFPRDLREEFTVGEKIFNPGTHVQTHVSCNTEGQCVIVEIRENKTVAAKKFLSGNLRFYRKTLTLVPGEMEAILNRELGSLEKDTVVELILTGAVTEEEYDNRREMIEGLLSRFVEGTYDDYKLSKLISPALIASEFAETSFSAGLLMELLEEPKEAQLAYELLKSLKEGK